MGITLIDELPMERLKGARVLVRINRSFDLPSAIPTLEFLIAAGTRTTIAAGAPGTVGDSLAEDLRRMLGRPVVELRGFGPGDVLRQARPDEILLLPDLGSYAEDASNDPEFARQLGSLAEVYCDDASGMAHLSLASTVGVVRFVRTAAAGFGLAYDINRMETLVEKATPPVGLIIGGADLESKLTLIWNLCGKADWLFLGGTICFPFFRARGLEVGGAPVDERLVPAAREISRDAKGRTEIILPADFVAVRRSSPLSELVAATNLTPDHVPMDIGYASQRVLENVILNARTLFWRGPLGVWEIEPFGEGTRAAAHLLARPGQHLAGIVSGDSLTAALRQFDLWTGLLADMGAPSQPVLRFLSGQILPGVEALRRPATAAKDESRRVILVVEAIGSLEAVRQSASLLATTGAEIHLLLVDQPRRRETPANSEPLKAATIFEQADALLARFGLSAAAHVVREGEPAGCVLDYAQETGADLLGVPSYSLPRPVRVLSGDWPQKLAKHSRLPILFAKAPGQ